MFEFLKELIGEAYTDEVEKKVAQEVGKSYVPKSKYDEVNSEKKKLETTIGERDAQLEALKGVDADGLKAQIETLQAENKTAAEKFEADLRQVRLDAAIETALIGAKAVNTKAVRALLDPAKITLEGEAVKGLDEQLAALKESQKWAFADESAAGTTGRDHGSGSGAEPTVQDAIAEAMYPKKT
jgi:hypothetical protein